MKNEFTKGLYFCGLSFDVYSEKPFNYNINHENNFEFLLLNTIGCPRACVQKRNSFKKKFNTNLIIGEDANFNGICKKFQFLTSRCKYFFIESDHSERTILNNKSLNDIKLEEKIIKQNEGSIRKKLQKNIFLMHII